jgi:hypothetical protein
VHNPDHGAIFVDQADLLGIDFTVDPQAPVVALAFAKAIALKWTASAASTAAAWWFKWTNG